MRRILAFALLAAAVLVAAGPVSVVTAGKAAADVKQGKSGGTYSAARRGR
jgi:hypothetical protein